RDPAFIGHQKTRGSVDEGGLARTGASEEHGDPGRSLEPGVERESWKGMSYRDLEHHAPTTRVATCRFTSSDITSAAMETPIETRISFMAAVSPPGTCRKA